ncbi:MAG: Uma2 family endonuclease [Thiohalospira sp.]
MTAEAVEVPEARRHRFSVEDYQRMVDAGVFGEDQRLELVQGEVLEMAPIGSWHAGCVNTLARRFFACVGDRGVVAVQNPVALPPDSEPQPDIAVLAPRADGYADAHPGPEAVRLLVEVAEASSTFDLGAKAALYAAAGIPEYWVVDGTTGELVVHRGPAAERWGEIRRPDPDEAVIPLHLPDCSLRARDLPARPGDQG